MKFIVDKMPEKAQKCKFHGVKDFVNGYYTCSITCKTCPLEEGNTCRVLAPLNEAIRNYVR